MFFAILFQCLPYNHKNPFYPKMSYFENFHWTKKYFLKFSTFSTFQIVVPPTKQPIAQSETGNGNRKKRPGKALYVPKALRDKPKPSGGTEEVRFQFHVNFIWRKINNDFIFFPWKQSVVPHVAVAEVVPKMKTWQDEIESQTGPIQIVEPLTDFILFETGCYTSKDKAFRRVVELGDFPKGKNHFHVNFHENWFHEKNPFFLTLSCRTENVGFGIGITYRIGQN